jgi:Sigma-70, region 4
MIAVHNFRQAEFRERVTGAIVEMLADLPETQRKTFIWNHYRGYQPKQIAEILRCSPPEIEATLDAINSILYQRTHSLLVEDPQLEAGMDPPAASSQQSVLEPIAVATGALRGWSESFDRLAEDLAKA